MLVLSRDYDGTVKSALYNIVYIICDLLTLITSPKGGLKARNVVRLQTQSKNSGN